MTFGPSPSPPSNQHSSCIASQVGGAKCILCTCSSSSTTSSTFLSNALSRQLDLNYNHCSYNLLSHLPPSSTTIGNAYAVASKNQRKAQRGKAKEPTENGYFAEHWQHDLLDSTATYVWFACCISSHSFLWYVLHSICICSFMYVFVSKTRT
jgi:hypothetical protein